MKKLLFLFSISISLFSQSQITLTSVDFATGGDTVRMSQASDNGYDYVSTGAGYIWDFSALTPNSQSLKDFRSMAGVPAFIQFIFGSFAPPKYQASYYIESTDLPIDQITSFLPVTIEDIFQFTRTTADSMTLVGYSMVVDGNDLPFKSDTIETKFGFDLQYGNTHFSRGYTKIDFNPIVDAIWNQHRTRFTEVDGYGTITTPYGVFDALRIRHDITEIDSLYMVIPVIGGTWIPLDVPDSHEYEWWTNDEMEPILKIVTNDIFGTETVVSIEYRDIYRGLDAGISEMDLQFGIYPNPAVDEVKVNSKSAFNRIQIVDSKGAVLMDKESGLTNTTTIDLSKLVPGEYKIIIHGENESGVKSFIKQ